VKKTIIRFLIIFGFLAFFTWLLWWRGLYFLNKYTPYENNIILLTSSSINDDKGIFMLAHVGSEITEPRLFVLPASTLVQLPDDYGEYELGAVLPLLNLDEKSEAYKRAVFSRIFGVPVSAFLAVSEPTLTIQKFGRIQQILQFAALKQLRYMQTPWLEAAIVPLLSERHVVITNTLEDIRKQLQQNVTRTLSRSQLSCTLAIINTTPKSGLAGELAAMLEQSGVRVVRITDSSQEFERSKFVVDLSRQECGWVKALVQSWFFTELELVSESSVAESEYRAWGAVFIGADAY